MQYFQNESQVEQFGGEGGLTIENGVDRLRLFGQIDITRDKVGLETARDLLTTMEEIVGALSIENKAGMLPEKIEEKPLGEGANPFL